jgi:spermidine/putrescine transport system permease protein
MSLATSRGEGQRASGRALRSYYFVLLTLLYLPLAILFVFSLASNTSIAFPLRGFSLEWYQRVFDDPGLMHAISTSIQVGIASSTIATVLGTCLAVLLVRYNFRGKRLLAGLAVLPLIAPAVVLAVALLALFRAFDLPLSMVSIVVAHVVIALPFTTLIVFSRLLGFDRALEDAAMDLGATYVATLRLIVLPMILPAVFAAWLVAFTVSFDEVALALFLAGRDPTFPVYLAGHIRFVGNLPILVAAAVLLMIVSLALILVAERVRRLR